MGKKSRNPRIGICTYCGRKRQITKDHIPPKNLFPKPRPSDLITVPCCLECNQRISKDDEYFRLVITMRYDVSQRRDASEVLPIALRGLQRADHTHLRRKLLEGIREVELRSPLGLYAGRTASYEVDVADLFN